MPKRQGPTFASAADAIAELERRHGPRSALWTYHDAEGQPCGLVVRWDREDGKDIRPAALIAGRWHLGGLPEPRPLYGLPEVLTATIVFVCEGEKAADAVRGLGLTATTSAHGSQSADKTDWHPLAGKTVVILPDNDEAGNKYADAVAAILGKLLPRPTIKIVELPDLPVKGDAVDFIAGRDGHSPEAIRAEIERLAEAAEAIPAERRPAPLQYRPFPVDVLPEPIRSVARKAARALGCDPSFIILPLLAALGAAIGNTRRLLLKGSWEVPPILWTAIVAHSGAVKSPAIDVARKPVQSRQTQSFKAYRIEREVFETALEDYERERREYQTGKRKESPARPSEPTADRYYCDDVTVEAIAARLEKQPRGLLLIRDELAGWFGGFDRYAGSKGGDAPKWLEMFGGRPILVDRKSGEPIHVERAAVCVTGSIQPAILKRNLSASHRESGLAARMLFAYPPPRVKRWTEQAIEPRDHDAIRAVFERLYAFEFATDGDGELAPIVVPPTADAKALFVEYFNSHAKVQAELDDDLGAAWSKLEEYAARLALVVHCVRVAAGDLALDDKMQLDAVSMQSGIDLAHWFANEARRIYAMLDEGEEGAERRQLIEWIGRFGGRVTPRDLQQGNRRFRTSDDAEQALIELVELGHGEWEPSVSGRRGQPVRRFVLSSQSTLYGNSSNHEENGNTVDVDAVDQAADCGDWGELRSPASLK